MKKGRKPEYPVKTQKDELQKLPPIKPENSSPTQDSKSHSGLGGRLGKQTC